MSNSQAKTRGLTDDMRARLRGMAPRFDITVSGSPESGMDLLSPGMSHAIHFDDWQRGHLRLLTEVCAQCLRWLPFQIGESCDDTLFRKSDEEMARIGVLYGVWRDKRAQEVKEANIHH